MGSIKIFSVFKQDKHILIFIILFLFAFIFKFILLAQRTKYFIDPDEGYYLILARNLVESKGYALNGLPNIIFPPFLPLLIGLFFFVFKDFIFSLNLITALSGVIIGFIVYEISKKKLSLPGKLGVAILALFIYQLNAFIPLSSRYIKVLYRGSDILNVLLIITSLYFIIKLVEENQNKFSILSGLFLSLAYLTRPEAFILYILLIFILIIFKFFSLGGLSYQKIISFVFTFMILASPYILYLQQTTGQWMISGKITAAQKYRNTLLKVIENEDWSSFFSIHYSLNNELLEIDDVYFGFYKETKTENNKLFDIKLKTIWENLGLYFIIPKTIFPLYLLPFFLLGLWKAILDLKKKKNSYDVILLILFPYSLLIEVLSYPIPRHHLFLLPVFIYYSVQGIIFLSSKFSRKNLITKRKMESFILVLIIGLIINTYIKNIPKSLFLNPRFERAKEVEVRISQILKEKKAEVIMSTHPEFAVRAQSDWQVLPIGSLQDIVCFALKKEVDFIILREKNKLYYHIIDISNNLLKPKKLEKPVDFHIIERNDYFDFWILSE